MLEDTGISGRRHAQVGLRAPRAVCPTSSRSASSWATAIWVAGALLRPEVIEAFGKRIRSFNTFGGNPASCAVAHAVLKVIKAGRRLVLISATGNEGQILKIRPPLVFSSKDAKLFLATLDEVLTALWWTPPAGLQARGRWDQGRLIEPTRSVSAPFAALSTTLSGVNTAHGQWQRSFDCRVRC